MPETKVAVGCLIGIQYHTGPHRLGLVVNQEAGQRWVSRDPFPPNMPEGAQGLLLVRLMGEYISDLHYPGNNKLWGEEPRRSMTVRWTYIQERPNPWVVAGPDTFSIEKFFGACRTCEAFGMNNTTFMGELQILLDHLKGRTKSADDTGIFERRYRAMLAEVLPQS